MNRPKYFRPFNHGANERKTGSFGKLSAEIFRKNVHRYYKIIVLFQSVYYLSRKSGIHVPIASTPWCQDFLFLAFYKDPLVDSLRVQFYQQPRHSQSIKLIEPFW